ncbi:DUF3857 domain-containing protein [Bryobacter aggregatus]|uniref:DUF3857 domain-containing protein n=1 Tax=Bryobacter aggregatus TaxID=360054 RepID=UPI00138DFB94|nr:DUF3857 domain-containing protein [Bryobacter aggregatus]
MSLLLLGGVLQAEIPGWFREIATATHPVYPPQAKAVVLFEEEKVTIDETGRQLTTHRKAVKILTIEGKAHAMGMLSFDTKDSKVKDFKAWIQFPSGKTKEYTKKDLVESNMSDIAIYSSYKHFGIRAGADADPNAIFGFESTVEEKTVFTQYRHRFQSDQPQLVSRFQITPPAGWKAEAKAYDGASATATIDGGTYTWEARKLDYLEREPGAPQYASLVPRIRVTLIPPAGQTSAALPTFATWKDVSIWTTKITDPKSEVTAAVEAKARSLASGKEGLDKVKAIGDYVQSLRYVAISTDISKGGGYVPHSADEVLRMSYGDCKDKANLMKTMLKVVGVESWMVSIYSGDPRYTREDWPSPMQFNHAIVAISTPAETNNAASFTHPALGRMMLFDPTDSIVPFGHIPDHEQGALALVLAGEKGTLIEAPKTSPTQNHTARKWDVTLAANGSLVGKLEETMTGQEAFDALALDKTVQKDRLGKYIEARMTAAIPGSVVTEVKENYEVASKTYTRTIQFNAETYARIMMGKLWMVKSSPMSYESMPVLNKATRTQPLVLQPVSFSETITWHLPSTLKIDELPDPDKMEAGFGKYDSTWKTEDGAVRVERQLELQAEVVPVAQYAKARELMMRFQGSEVAPIVLVAK